MSCAPACAAVAATPVTGIIQNSREPWQVKDDRNRVFECRWVSGYNLFGRGDSVLLSDERGQVTMEGLSGPSKGKKAQVRVKLLP